MKRPTFLPILTASGLFLSAAFLAAATPPQLQSNDTTSQLWGENGENWTPTSRLPDFSFCGYQYGELPVPRVPVVADITDFGANGQDALDDTTALKAAIAHVQALPRAERGAILIPEGKFILSDLIHITASGVVIRGVGPEKTELVFSDMEIPGPSFEEMRAHYAVHWNWREFWAEETGKKWASIVKKRGFVFGDTKLSKNIWRLPKPEDLLQFPILPKPGYPDRGSDFVLLAPETFEAFQKAFALNEPVLLAGKVANLQTPDGKEKLGGNPAMNELTGGAWGEADANFSVSFRQELRIRAIEENKVFFDRTIRVPYGDSPAGASLFKCDREYAECGIEDLRLSYSDRAFISHFMITGREPIRFEHTVRHSWARNLILDNVDNGIVTKGRHITLSGITFNSNRAPTVNPAYAGISAHHLASIHGAYNLLENFRINTKSVHDLTLSNSIGCIISNGSGLDINFDHHRQVPYENLFVEIDVGEGSRLFFGTGNSSEGPSIGAYNTYWNIRSEQKQGYPDNHPSYSFCLGAGMLNLVGLNSDRPSLYGPRRWMETMPPATLYPANIFEAQRQKRLNSGRNSSFRSEPHTGTGH